MIPAEMGRRGGRRLDASLVALGGLLVVGICLAATRNPPVLGDALLSSWRVFQGTWMDIVLGFLIAGLLDVLVPKAWVLQWFSAEHGARSMGVAWLVGLALPGGPYVVFPIIGNLARLGTGPGPLITLITAKMLVSPIRTLTYEVPLLGWRLTLARVIPSLLLPPVMGVVGSALYGWLKPPS